MRVFSRILGLLALLCSSAFAFVLCKEVQCKNMSLSLGYHYSSFTSPYSTSSNHGGYLDWYGGYYIDRFYIGLDVLGGFSSSSLDNSANTANKSTTLSPFVYVAPHIGVRFGERDTPTLLYIAPSIERYDMGRQENGGFIVTMMFVELNVFDRSRLSESLNLETQLGISPYNARRIHINNDTSKLASSFDGSFRVSASLGLSGERFFMRLKGIYFHNKSFDITPSLKQPQSNDYAAMLEAGFRFKP